MFSRLKTAAISVDEGIGFGESSNSCEINESPPVSASSAESSATFLCYRENERKQIVASLLAGSSLLVVGTAGIGKTTLARFVIHDLEGNGVRVASACPASVKQWLGEVAIQLGCIEANAKIPSVAVLQLLIADAVKNDAAVIICDDAHRLSASIRIWLETLISETCRVLLVATLPPPRDIFLKLPRLGLPPLSARYIRRVMQSKADALGVQLTPAQFSALQERCGGNPMLAGRVVREHSLGIESEADHAQWIDGTPLLIAALMIFTVLRFIGRGMGATDIYLIGGILTVAIGVMRLLLYSLPRKSNKLGA